MGSRLYFKVWAVLTFGKNGLSEGVIASNCLQHLIAKRPTFTYENSDYTLTDSRYKEKFTSICEEIFEFGLKEHEKREAEIASFFSCLEEATKDNNNAGVKHIHNYIEYKKKVRTYYENLVSIAGIWEIRGW